MLSIYTNLYCSTIWGFDLSLRSCFMVNIALEAHRKLYGHKLSWYGRVNYGLRHLSCMVLRWKVFLALPKICFYKKQESEKRKIYPDPLLRDPFPVLFISASCPNHDLRRPQKNSSLVEHLIEHGQKWPKMAKNDQND